MGRDAHKAQKAARKRKEREKRVREQKARRREGQATGRRAVLTGAGELPLKECLISSGWRDRGRAHILVARELSPEALVVGGYLVDLWCLGLKDTAVFPDLSPEDYEEKVKPNLFNDPVEFEPCDPATVRGLVEGAIAYAADLGFRPNKRWEESSRLLKGVEVGDPGAAFGREGRPCLVVGRGENLRGAVTRLERKLGRGNFDIVGEDEGEAS